MDPNTIQEISRRSIFLTKTEETILSWKNSVLAVRSDRGAHYFQFTYNLQCLDKNIDLLEFSTPVVKESPAANIFTEKLFSKQWRNYDFTEMLVTPVLWPHNPLMLEELTNISEFEWSPRGFVPNCECALAILNNVGNINFYMFRQNKWVNVFSLAQHLRNFLPEDYTATNLDELKHAVNVIDACGMCWAPYLNPDNSSFFVTAQKDGTIVFWCLQSCGYTLNARVCGKINDNMEEISTMRWISLSDEKFLLVCADFFGRIIAYECIVSSEEIKNVNVYVLWSCKDRMHVKYFHHIKIDNKIILLFNKHRHLVIQMIDEHYKVISQYVKNINDYRITSITYTTDGFYVSTVNCKIYKIDLNVIDNSLNASLNPIEFKVPCETYELYSIGFSANNVIIALGMINRKAMYRKEPILLDVIFSSTEKKLEAAVSILMNNPTKKLTEYWDCVELIRYKAMKTNSLPSIDLTILYTEADTDVYKLKIYLILVKLYWTLKKVIKIGNDVVLPETSIEHVKGRILLDQALNTLNDTYNIYKSKNELTNFELECYQGAQCYLKFYCEKYKKLPEEYISTDRLNYINNTITYTCQCCDENLEEFSCKNGHLNMICTSTFTPIDSDEYLVCKSCKAIARVELFPMNAMCVFCDLYLGICYVNI